MAFVLSIVFIDCTVGCEALMSVKSAIQLNVLLLLILLLLRQPHVGVLYVSG